LQAQTVSFDTAAGEGTGVVLNLCEGGMAVHTRAHIEQGSVKRLRWQLRQPAGPPGGEGAVMRADKETGSFTVEFPNLTEHTVSLEAEGVVAWTDRQNQRFGIKFQNLSDEVRQSIFRWALHHALPTPHPALPDPSRPNRNSSAGAIIQAPFPAALVPAQLPSLPFRPPHRPSTWVSTLVFVASLGLASLGIGAYWQAHANNPTALAASVPILRLSGSNTIGETLAPALAQAFLKQLGAKEIQTVPGSHADEESVQAILPSFLSGSSRVEIRISAHGSSTAFDDLMNASCDIGMASRKIKPKEISRLSDLGDLSSPASEHLLALDGIAVIVSGSNPVQTLTKDQLAAIFAGTIFDWSQVGGQHAPINIYAPDNKSGTYDTFKTLVLGGKSLSGIARRLEDSRALSESVSADRNAIGFIGLPYVLHAKAIAVAERGAYPFQPNRLTVGTEDYLLSRRLYLYTPAKPQNKYVEKFLAFALSREGQDVVGEAGFIAQNVTSERDMVVPGASNEYRRLTKGAGRLSLDFRFLPGLSVLDSKSKADLDRVVTFLADSGFTGNDLLLLGFTDNTGDRNVNLNVSQNRARIVAAEFAQRGLRPATVKGFGSDTPVAANDTDAGRERNRRVEIWLKDSQCVAPRATRDPS
jgi:phosphate transport system substrate-binding protein